MKDIFLSVVIPCYDEMANLQKGVLEKVQHFLEKKQISYEVIIVDDGSKDGSARFVKDFCKENHHFKLIEISHFGKAGAVTKGMLAAKGQYRLFTDMDQATPIEELDKLLPFFQKGYDVVVGSRNTERKGAPFIRKAVSVGSILMRKILVGLSDISDTQCGFKMFTSEAADVLFNKIHSMHHGFQRVGGANVASGFDVELLILARKNRYKIKEVPVRWLYVESGRVSPFTDSVRGVLALLKIKKNMVTGKYE